MNHLIQDHLLEVTVHRYTLLHKIGVYIELISYVYMYGLHKIGLYVLDISCIIYLPPPSFSPSLSLQDTLEEASALLKEIEARDSRQISSQTSTDNKQQSCDTSNEPSSNSQDRLEG